MDVIGLIPAAGQSKRLPKLPCSKEIFPIGIGEKTLNGQTEKFPRPIISYLLEQLMFVGVKKSVIVISKDKSDIIRFLGGGSNYGMNFTYQVQETMRGMPFAMDLAYPWIKESIVVFGMPDTVFAPQGAFQMLLEKLKSTQADITLGLFPTSKPQKFGMVEYVEETNDFIYTIDKPDSTDLRFMWGIACWGPQFTEYLHTFVENYDSEKELVFSTILQNAHQKGLRINCVPFPEGTYIDIGTPEDLIFAMQKLGGNISTFE